MREIVEIIRKSRSVAIAGHINADGDSVGSCFATAHALKKMGKRVCVLMEDFGEKYTILPGVEFLHKGSVPKIDLFIAQDCGDAGRLGKFAKTFTSVKNIVIDHHINDGFGDFNWIESSASSTCEIIYKLICELGIKIDYDIAYCLYAGIVTDTGGFRFKCTSADTMEIAGKLLQTGIPHNFIYEHLMYRQSLRQFQGFLKVVGAFTVVEDVSLVYTTVTLAQMQEMGINRADLDGVVNMFKRIRDMDIAIFAYEKGGGRTKVSMRSDTFDVNELATHFGGGGHKHASGADMMHPPEACVGMIIERLRQCKGL